MKSAENTAVTDKVLKEHEFESHFSFDIRPHVRVTEYEKGEYIIRNTDQLTRILYLVQGTAKLYGFHKNGRQSLINFFTPFSLFGVPELFEENKRPYPLVAQTRCRFIEIDTKLPRRTSAGCTVSEVLLQHGLKTECGPEPQIHEPDRLSQPQ